MIEPLQRRAGLGLWWVVGGACALFGLLLVGSFGARGLVFVAITLGPWAAIAWLLRQRWIRVDRDGIAVRGLLGTTSLAWNEVRYYTMSSKGRGSAGGVGGAVLGLAVAAIEARAPRNRMLVGHVTLHGGSTRIVIGPGWRDLEAVLDVVFARVHPLLRERADFEPFTLGATQLEHPQGSIAYDQLERVIFTGGKLVFRLHGQERPYATLRSDKIRNVMLFAAALIDRGARVVTHDAFIPADFGDLLAAQRPAIPEARVVS